MAGAALQPSDLAPGLLLGEGVEIGEGVLIGGYAVIHAGVRIGDGARVGDHAQIRDRATIGDGATIGSLSSVDPGAGVVICPAIEVGEEAFVAAGAVVAAAVAPRAVVMGVPARPTRQVPDEDLLERWR